MIGWIDEREMKKIIQALFHFLKASDVSIDSGKVKS